MLDGYKIVCVTPAGRRQTMRLLMPYVLSNPIVDQVQVWINTNNLRDREFINRLQEFSKITLIEQPDGFINGNLSIGAFFRHATEADTVYIRLDDDVVWMNADAIETLVRFRLHHRSFFIISALVLNNAICTNLLQNYGRWAFPETVSPYSMDEIGWKNPQFAERLHREVLEAIESGGVQALRIGGDPIPIANVRLSINCISWMGETFARFRGVIEGDEEEYLSVTLPQRLRAVNCICGDSLVAHYSFFTQKTYLDQTDLLSRYSMVMDQTSWVDKSIVGRLRAIATAVEKLSLAGEVPLQHGSGHYFKVPVPVLKVRWASPYEILRAIRRRMTARSHA